MTRILIIEDSPTQAQQLAILLGDADFDAEIAPDASQGYARAASGQFSLVVTDLHLPDESGFTLCRRIKSNRDLQNIPVLILTADSNPEDVLRGLEAGADGFMTKDHSPSEIVRRVQRTLAGGARRVCVDGVDCTRVVFRENNFLLKPSIEQLLNILLAAFEDVTNLNDRLKANEAALRQLNAEIRKANNALAEANRLKDKFLAMAAHDLRNPLGTIQVMASMMLEGECEPDERIEFLKNMIQQSDHMLLLIQDLLSASASRGGKLELKPVLQDPAKILRRAFDGFVLIARKKGVDLVWQVPSSLPSAELDVTRMTEVLSNLISNSVKFCSPGQAVYLAARAVNSNLEISVRDTGPGIRPEELPRLFEPFAKLSNKPTAGEPSTGLGLSIVKDIVEGHGGHVSAHSALGQGTTFKLALPLHHPHAAVT